MKSQDKELFKLKMEFSEVDEQVIKDIYYSL